ncbi:MAG: hypothetical protein WC449_05610 [Candidatus Paceibacterota bacterium]
MYKVGAPTHEADLYATATEGVWPESIPENYRVINGALVYVAPPAKLLSDIKYEAKQRVNAITQEVIFAKYPQPKQANLQARFSQLIYLGTATPDNAEVIAIQAVWDDILAMRTASNVANSAIDSAMDEAAVNVIVSGFTV